jgi:hypothetical protein
MTDASAALWKKLNLKDGLRVAVVDTYGAMAEHVAALDAAHAATNAPKADTGFFLALATTLAEVEAHARAAAGLGGDDPVVWVAYPKGTSKRHRCEFNRDTGWSAMGEAGFEPVRQVAIDDDWSALRFRRVKNIKTMTRALAMTAEGQEKAAKGRGKKG